MALKLLRAHFASAPLTMFVNGIIIVSTFCSNLKLPLHFMIALLISDKRPSWYTSVDSFLPKSSSFLHFICPWVCLSFIYYLLLSNDINLFYYHYHDIQIYVIQLLIVCIWAIPSNTEFYVSYNCPSWDSVFLYTSIWVNV